MYWMTVPVMDTSTTRNALTPANREFLAQLPRGPLRYAGFDLIHGSPADEDEYLITLTDIALIRPYLGAQLSFFGHTQSDYARMNRAKVWARWDEVLECVERLRKPDRMTGAAIPELELVRSRAG